MTPDDVFDFFATWWPVILAALPFILSTARAVAKRTATPRDDEIVELASGVLGDVLGRASLVEPDSRAPSVLKSPLARTWQSDRTEDDIRREHEESARGEE